MLVGDYEEYSVRHIDVGIVVDSVDDAHEAAGGIEYAEIGLCVATYYANESGECLHDERLFGLDAGYAAVVHKYHVRHGRTVSQTYALHRVRLLVGFVEIEDFERCTFCQQLLCGLVAVDVACTCHHEIVDSLVFGSGPVGCIAVGLDVGWIGGGACSESRYGQAFTAKYDRT